MAKAQHLAIIFITAILFSGCSFSEGDDTTASANEKTAMDGGTIITAESGLYFSETGHTVQEPFLSYYLAHDGLTRLGYPITEPLDHEGWRVQYFQYARLEIHPENHPDYFITVGWLGQFSHRTQPPIYNNKYTPNLYFPETGHTLSGDFLTYFEAQGDTVQFGRPISEPFLHQGLVTQDLQSARFIWRPDLPPPVRVQLEPLGETYFLGSDLPLDLLSPVSPSPDGELFDPPDIPLPSDTTASLTVEETPRAGMLRVVATFLKDGLPIEGYRPYLAWGDYRRRLPPTGSAGQTHALVDISGSDVTEFKLYPASEQTPLATVSFSTGN
jgi:hypothetical protein